MTDSPRLLEKDGTLLWSFADGRSLPVIAGGAPFNFRTEMEDPTGGDEEDLTDGGDEPDEPEDAETDTEEADDVDDEEETDEPAGDQGDPAAEEETPELILGKFKSNDDVVRAYQELERKLGELSSAAPEDTDKETEPESPARFSGTKITEPEDIPELIDMAQEDPTAAALWVLNNQGRFQDAESREAAIAVLDHFTAKQPWAAMQIQIQLAQQQAGAQAQPQEPAPPSSTDVYVQREIMSKTLATVASRIPDYWETYQPRIQKMWEEQGEEIFNQDELSDPTKLEARIVEICQHLYGQDRAQSAWKQKTTRSATPPAEEDPEAEAAAEAERTRTKTETRSSTRPSRDKQRVEKVGSSGMRLR